MAETGGRALLSASIILFAGVLFCTFVNSQEIRAQGNAMHLEDQMVVERARNVERTKGRILELLDQVVRVTPKENFVNDKRSDTERDATELQIHEQMIKFKNGKVDVLKKRKIRKPRAEPETSPSSEPETSPSSEPEVNPESEVKPEVNPESEVKPEANPNSTSEPEPFLHPEPEPEWDTAVEVWQTAWPIHVYGIASIFVVLGITSLLELIRIHVKSKRKTALKVSLLIMIAVFCTTRAVVLYTDPYGSKGTINTILSRILFSIGHPCIISSMSLLLLVLIDTTKMNVAPPTFQRIQFIIAIVVFHVVLVIITDIVVAYYFETKILILICQIYYLLVGFILTVGYAKVGIKINTNSSASVTRDTKMEKLKILIGLASITGFAMVGATIYGAAGVFGIYSDVKVVAPWPWWVFQTVLRILEVVMVVVLLLMTVNVSGSGLSVREFFGKCRRRLLQNKIEGTSSMIHVNNSNSWMTHSQNT